MKNHRSIRNYTNQDISEEIIKELVNVAQAAPNSINGQQTIKLLGLPEYTFPILGVAAGYPSDNSKMKPRIPKALYRHNEKYNSENIKEAITQYDKEMAAYLKDIGRIQEVNWSSQTMSIYQYVYYPKVYLVLKDQGFENSK